MLTQLEIQHAVSAAQVAYDMGTEVQPDTDFLADTIEAIGEGWIENREFDIRTEFNDIAYYEYKKLSK